MVLHVHCFCDVISDSSPTLSAPPSKGPSWRSRGSTGGQPDAPGNHQSLYLNLWKIIMPLISEEDWYMAMSLNMGHIFFCQNYIHPIVLTEKICPRFRDIAIYCFCFVHWVACQSIWLVSMWNWLVSTISSEGLWPGSWYLHSRY